MKKLLSIGTVICISAAVFASCKDSDDPQVPPPYVKLTSVGASATTVTFKISPSDAQAVAYAVVPSGSAVPAAAELLASGLKADPSAEKEYTADGLDPAADYTVAAVAAAGDVYSEVKTLTMTTSEEPGPDWDVETECINIIAEYYGNEKLGGDNGQFWINLTDMEVDAGGNVLSDGTQYALSIHSDLAEDWDNPAPAAGTYTLDILDTFDKFTIAGGYSKWIRLKNVLTDPSQEDGRFTEGTLDIVRNGDSYELTALLTTDEGLVHRVTYSGAIRWRNKTAPPIKDRNLDAVFGRSIYYATSEKNPDTDNWVIGLYDAPEQATAMLVLDFYSTVSDKPTSPVIPEGSYSPNDGTVTTAGTFTPGYNVDGLYDMGSYYSFSVEGKMYTYYLSEGSFTISRNGNEYTVSAELFMDDGTKVTGTFSGEFVLTNNYNPSLGADLDVTYDRVYDEPGNFRSGAVNEYYFCLADTEMTEQPAPVGGGEGNWLAVDLYSATAPADMSHITIPEGTYTWDPDNTDGTFDPYFSFGWHWDAEGVSYLINPVSGTVDVSRKEDGYYILLQWETDGGEKFVGQYTGDIALADKTVMAPGAMPRNMLYSHSAAARLQRTAPAPYEILGRLRAAEASQGPVFSSAAM